MSKINVTKTSFTSGEIDPSLYGRIDLRAYDDGAATLKNVLVQRTGGVSRRPGTEFVASVPSGCRLFPYDHGEIHDLLVFGDFAVHVVSDGMVRQTIGDLPWSIADVGQLDFTLVDEAVLVCHPMWRARLLRRDADGVWSSDWLAFSPFNADDADQRVAMPFARFAPSDIALQAKPIPGEGDPTESGNRFIEFDLVSSRPIFDSSYEPGTIFRLKGRQVELLGIDLDASGMLAYAKTLEPLVDTLATTDWDEQAFSDLHGWPITAAVHQNRLVLGGCRDRADAIWFSRSGRPFDFDLADGLDDAAIAFRIGAERRHAIRQMFSGRVLQVFTTAGEWTIGGFPLTPRTARVELQTRVGSLADRQVAPVDVDGATLFVGGNGRDLREFLFTETEQAYQAADIAILSRHLMRDPVDMTFDQIRRVFWIVRADGRACSVTIDRNSNIVAWTLQETRGSIKAMTIHKGALYALIDRATGLAVERFDDALLIDAHRRLTVTEPSAVWDGLQDLVGERYVVTADETPLGEIALDEPTVTLPAPASTLDLGLSFATVIEGLPMISGSGRGVAADAPYRPVRVSLRLRPSNTLLLDTGDGMRPIAFGRSAGINDVFDVSVRARGWRRGTDMPAWRIGQETPGPFELLSVTVEAKVNG
jgi:hypothetical protein